MSPAQLCVLGLDTQVYKQICKCQITEGDAETGEQSDTFSKKTNKQTNIQAPIIAFTSLLLHFPFFDFFCFPLNCDICNRGEDCGLQSVNISSQLNLSRRMLIHSTVRKCNSLLEEKILLLYWPPPKIPLNTPHCVHTHTPRQQKNNTGASGIQVANLF